MNEKETIFGEEFGKTNVPGRRRDLLPLWIKVFTWIFMITGGLSVIIIPIGLWGMQAKMALYGLSTTEPLSITGLILSAVFFIKGVTALALWSEKDWAIKAGIFDTILGIIICVYMMVVSPFLSEGFSIKLRLELALLIPFLLKLRKIKDGWENGFN